MRKWIGLGAALSALSVVAWSQTPDDRKHEQEIRVEVKAAHDALAKAHQELEQVTVSLGDWGPGGAVNERVDVDVKDASVRDALKQVLGKVKQEYVVTDDVSADARVSIAAKNVKVRTVLDLIAQAAGIGWQRELKAGKTVFRFSKSIKQWDPGMPFVWTGDIASTGGGLGAKVLKLRSETPGLRGGQGLYSVFSSQEQRDTLTCAHCKSQITAIRKNVEVKCEKCGKGLEADWKVCPRDGAKRPAASGEWKFCPVCGKDMNIAKDK